MKKKMSNRDKTFCAVIIPVLILFFTFNTLPMIKGVIYSFTNYKGYGTYDYVGIRNYADLFTDIRVGKSYLFRLGAMTDMDAVVADGDFPSSLFAGKGEKNG